MSSRSLAAREIAGGAPAKLRSKIDLKEALRFVETLGLAPLARIDAVKPKNLRDWGRWHTRLREREQEVAAKLGEHGARVGWGDGAHFRFAGYRASSTMGLRQALLNWRKRVELELARRAYLGDER